MCLSSEPCQCSAEETVLVYWLCKSSCFQVLDCLNQNNSELYWFIKIQWRYESLRNTWDLRGASSCHSGALNALCWWPGTAAPSLPPASRAFPIPATRTPPNLAFLPCKQGFMHSDSAGCSEKKAENRRMAWIERNPPQAHPCPRLLSPLPALL